MTSNLQQAICHDNKHKQVTLMVQLSRSSNAGAWQFGNPQDDCRLNKIIAGTAFDSTSLTYQPAQASV
jgi:hypothetical protein